MMIFIIRFFQTKKNPQKYWSPCSCEYEVVVCRARIMLLYLLLVVSLVLCFSILGAILIVFGLYTVVWGKSKDPLPLDEPLKDEKAVNHELPITAANNSINGRT